jgi:hypothetical protein
MSRALGDFDISTIVYGKFTTFRPSTGASFTLGGTPAISVYKNNSTTQSTTGITLTVDFDSITGLNHFTIDTSADGTFYSAGSFFDIVITTGTVDSVSVVGSVVGCFTLRANSALKPTTAGRTLDVSAGGEAGLDWANIGSPTTAVNLSGTNIDTDQVVASVSGAVGSVTGLTASNLDVAVSSRLATAGYTAPDNAGIAAVKVVTDKIDTALVLDGSVYQYTANALELAPSSSGGGLDAAGVRAAIGLASANLDTQLSTIDTVVDAVKVKTDQLAFTSGNVNANTKLMNDAAVLGNGTEANLWRGA